MRGSFRSQVEGRPIAFESLIELDFALITDFDEGVLSIQEQPLTITYQIDDRLHKYTPDFLIVRRSHNTELVECKPATKVSTQENQQKFSAAETWCVEQGWQFRVVTDLELRTGCRLGNIRKLTAYATFRPGVDLMGRLWSYILRQQGDFRLQDAARSACPDDEGIAYPYLLQLIYQHKLLVDLDHEPLSRATMARLRAGFAA